MTLRTRLLAAFLVLGAVPLVGVSVVTSRRNLRAVEVLVAGETLVTAERIAEEIGAKRDERTAELLFLADNAETQALLGSYGIPAFAYAADGPERFLSRAWARLSGRFRWIRIEDTAGAAVLALANERSTRAGIETSDDASGNEPTGGPVALLEEVIRDQRDGRVLGSVHGAVEAAGLLAVDLEERGFGGDGFVAVLDTLTGWPVARSGTRRPSGAATPHVPIRAPAGSRVVAVVDTREQPAVAGQSFRYRDGDRLWVASSVPIAGTSLAAVSASPLDGFTRPFVSAARADLALVAFIMLLTSAAFLFITLRTTRSLVRLTGAARQVAIGDLEPDLPPTGRDEAGTLAAAFVLMLGRIRAMIRQVEESRQLAAVGEFSAQIAHELRNPLTAIRMNLQGLYRRLAETELGRPLEIALQETERLDRVASGVLSLGRKATRASAPIVVATLVRGAVDSVADEMRERRVSIRVDEGTGQQRIRADEEALRGALINLFRNGAEAMPDGGEIRVTIVAAAAENRPAPGSASGARDDSGVVQVHVVDQGPGVADAIAARIFDPFVTTKARGNGFGLALALRAAEANGGTIRLERGDPGSGAHFVLELPIHHPVREE